MKNKILKGIATLMAAIMLIGTAAVIPAQDVEAASWYVENAGNLYYSTSNSLYYGRTWSSLYDYEKENWYNWYYNGYWPTSYPSWPWSGYDYTRYNYYYNNYVNCSTNTAYDKLVEYPYVNKEWNELSTSEKWGWVKSEYGYDYYNDYYYYYYGYPYYYYYGYPYYYGSTISITTTETEKTPAKTQNNSIKTTYMSSSLVEKALKLIKSCESGENVSITMGKATHIDSDIMAALQGRNVTVYAKKGAYSWFINGKDIKDSSIDANIACTVNAGNIPEKLTKKFKGETVELSTVANSLTFKGYLYASIGSEGDKVDVYKYNGETLKKIATVTVDSDDEAGVKVTSGGDYLFVLR